MLASPLNPQYTFADFTTLRQNWRGHGNKAAFRTSLAIVRASWGALSKPQGRVIPVGLSSGPPRGQPGGFRYCPRRERG